jgi:hypothetical protein
MMGYMQVFLPRGNEKTLSARLLREEPISIFHLYQIELQQPPPRRRVLQPVCCCVLVGTW